MWYISNNIVLFSFVKWCFFWLKDGYASGDEPMAWAGPHAWWFAMFQGVLLCSHKQFEKSEMHGTWQFSVFSVKNSNNKLIIIINNWGLLIIY